jgi:hypothetical protein
MHCAYTLTAKERERESVCVCIVHICMFTQTYVHTYIIKKKNYSLAIITVDRNILRRMYVDTHWNTRILYVGILKHMCTYPHKHTHTQCE